jgi:hypothetical protein
VRPPDVLFIRGAVAGPSVAAPESFVPPEVFDVKGAVGVDGMGCSS